MTAATALGLLLALAAAGATSSAAEAAARIGVVCATRCEDGTLDRFRRALADVGLVEGRDMVLVCREAGGRADRLAAVAEGLARESDLLFTTWGTAAAIAARDATATLPIVAGAVGDPVAAGLVDTLARPQRNVTGVSTLALALEAKRMQLLKEIIPSAVRVAVLSDPDNPYSALAQHELQGAARSVGVTLREMRVVSAEDLEPAFAALGADPPDALIVPGYLVTVAERARITRLAAERRLPAVYSQEEFADAGGLVSYGVDMSLVYARAAAQVAKILAGASPAELPVEQPATFRLVVNLKAAAALGLTIPPALLARADEVIE